MAVVDGSLVALLKSLFGAAELHRLLRLERWSAALVGGLPPAEHRAPDAWFQDLVVAIDQHGVRPQLRTLLLREREARAEEIRAALPDAPHVRVVVAPDPRPALAEAPGADRAAPPDATPARILLAPSPRPAPPDAPKSARPAPIPWQPVRVLHLSDLHFSAKTAWDAGTVLERLAKDVARLCGAVGDIDIVVVTGDIGDQGLAEEYVQATSWLTGPLATAAGVTASAIRVVPGNHDVHRGSITRTAKALTNDLLNDADPQQAIAEVLSSETERTPLLARQAAYLSFAQTFHPGLTVPWWREQANVRGLTLHLAGLNSAWLSASDADRGNLLLSRWQCNQLLAGADEADLTLALLHHPWDFFSDLDRECEEEIRRRCAVILHGHLHQQKARLTSDPDRDVLQLAAGASYAGSKWANAYQLLELDPVQGIAKLHFRAWDGHDWIPDRNRYQQAPDGVATLPLRRSPRARVAQAPASPELPAPAASSRHQRVYREALRARLDAMPWLSKQLGLSRTLSQVCVSVEVHEQRALGHGSPMERDEHVPLIDVIGPEAARWVMLGDPGSGKSTLLRRLAWDLSHRGDWLPVLLHAGDLTQDGEVERAVKTVWGKIAAEVVSSWPVGRLIVLVDGLDEVGEPRKVQQAMLALAQDLGAASLIVAGRPEGYPEPWPGFGVLQIQPLALSEQERLLENLGVPEALVHSQLPRLRGDPRLREIVGRPLLLTLAALVLIQDGALPDKRVLLYRRAVECLLHRGELNPSAPIDVVRAPDDTFAALAHLAPNLLSIGPGPWLRADCVASLRADKMILGRLAHTWPGDTARLFLEESARTVGLLVPQDRGRRYAFAHRTFGEYLASCALVADRSKQRIVAKRWTAAPAQWAEVLALMVAQLPPDRADNIVAQLVKAGDAARPLLLRVLASAEGLSAETVRGVLGLQRGWEQKQLQARQKVIEEIPALVKDLGVAVGLLDQVAKATTCGHDLFWVREVLRRIERGEGSGSEADGELEDAKRAAKVAADNVLGHLDPAQRAALAAMLKPWWRPIPAGWFEMGEKGPRKDEDGNRIGDDFFPNFGDAPVTFTSGFQMLGVPVTWAIYRLFDPSHVAARETFGGTLPPKAQDEVPVYNVSWFAAVMFAEWVGARLPLEIEWEYACRAGTDTGYWSGNEEADLARVGWYGGYSTGGNAKGHPHPVAQKPANAWGLHDVHGNVWEWCADVYDGGAYARRTDGLTLDPQRLTFAVGDGLPMSAESADRGASRVLRGGSFNVRPEDARSAVRGGNSPSDADRSVGFRLLLCPPERP